MGNDTEDTAAPLEVRYEQGAAPTTAKVEIAGHDLTKILTRISFDHSGNQLPKVYLELKPTMKLPEVLVDAVVYLRETILEDPADAMLRFIEPLLNILHHLRLGLRGGGVDEVRGLADVELVIAPFHGRPHAEAHRAIGTAALGAPLLGRYFVNL